jgi:hypothetical protein
MLNLILFVIILVLLAAIVIGHVQRTDPFTLLKLKFAKLWARLRGAS